MGRAWSSREKDPAAQQQSAPLELVIFNLKNDGVSKCYDSRLLTLEAGVSEMELHGDETGPRIGVVAYASSHKQD